jgi:uncharacterized protein with HEPN domain
VIRNLQTLAESSQRLREELKTPSRRSTGRDWRVSGTYWFTTVHDYLGVGLELVCRAVERDVPTLKAACEALRRSAADRE